MSTKCLMKTANTMKALIKALERLYKDIDDIQLMWVKSAKVSNEEGKRFAIGLMHTTMNSVSQHLKCIIDRKDNIVDLGEVWHSIDVETQKGSWFVGQIGEKAYDTFVAEIEGESMKNWFEGCNIKRWAYIKDLLPKGGE